MKTTITEALANLKTINARLEKKRQSVLPYVARDSRIVDPLAGGTSVSSAEFIKRERQAINDLETETIRIRTAIQKANLETSLTIGNITRTISEWLIWRRELSSSQNVFLVQLSSTLNTVRTQLQKPTNRASMMVASAVNEAQQAPTNIVVNIDETALIAEVEQMAQTLGELDGKLSLLNATTLIEY